MARNLLNWIALTIAVGAADYLIPGISHDSLAALAVAALVLALLNAVLKPILALLSLPFIILTLGLFFLLINAALLKLTAWLVPGFHVATWPAALLGGLVISLVHLVLGPGNPRSPARVARVRLDPPDSPRTPPPGKGPVIDV
jgi:putative membrane protein